MSFYMVFATINAHYPRNNLDGIAFYRQQVRLKSRTVSNSDDEMIVIYLIMPIVIIVGPYYYIVRRPGRISIDY